MYRTLAALLLASVALSPVVAAAAEIRIRSAATPKGGLVLLGDIAEIFARGEEEAERLAAAAIAPAPAPGARRFLRLADIKRALERRGVRLAEHRFSGASTVTLQSPDRIARGDQRTPARVAPTNSRGGATAASDAILVYLGEKLPEAGNCQIDVRLSPSQQVKLAAAETPVRASGGRAPWVGDQQFTLQFGAEHLPVRATVRLPTTAVVAVRSLPRGVLVRREDLALREVELSNLRTAPGRTLGRVEDAVGKETIRAIRSGQLLDRRWLRSPLLVRRGEVLTVYARSSGISVRTVARATQDGSQGEVITVETLGTAKRRRFEARVVEPQVVEVWAGAIPASSDPVSPPNSLSPLGRGSR